MGFVVDVVPAWYGQRADQDLVLWGEQCQTMRSRPGTVPVGFLCDVVPAWYGPKADQDLVLPQPGGPKASWWVLCLML